MELGHQRIVWLTVLWGTAWFVVMALLTAVVSTPWFSPRTQAYAMTFLVYSPWLAYVTMVTLGRRWVLAFFDAQRRAWVAQRNRLPAQLDAEFERQWPGMQRDEQGRILPTTVPR